MKWNGRGYQKVPEKILKPYDNGKGYLQVQLYKEGKMKSYLVHRLVATVFCENPKGYTEVNHLDEDKQNNMAENLEFCSAAYNINYGTRNKRVGKKNINNPKKSKPVFSVNKESGLIMLWESTMEAERMTGIYHGSITRCCQGKLNSAGNHIWFYADDEDAE